MGQRRLRGPSERHLLIETEDNGARGIHTQPNDIGERTLAAKVISDAPPSPSST